MRVIHQQLDCRTMGGVLQASRRSCSIEVNQQKSLILNSCEKIVFSDEVEYIGSTETQEVRQCFAWLAIGKISEGCQPQSVIGEVVPQFAHTL